MGSRGTRFPIADSRFPLSSTMPTAKLLVTLIGLALIAWVLWYFLVPPRPVPRTPRRDA